MPSPISMAIIIPRPRIIPEMKNHTKLLPNELNNGIISPSPGNGWLGYNTPYNIIKERADTIPITITEVEFAGSPFPCVISGNLVMSSPQIA